MIAVEIRDPREQQLADIGDLWLVDPETGRQLRVDTRSRKLRRRFDELAAADRDEVAARAALAGRRRTSCCRPQGDWLKPLIGFLKIERRRR